MRIVARDSALSRAQVEEVIALLRALHGEFVYTVHYVETYGDRDRTTSLRDLGATDFFTREVDALVLSGECDIAVHSAKDLPDPLPSGLVLAALTEGLDARDVLVLREEGRLPWGARIGTSSRRREEALKALRGDLQVVDIRGTIEERLGLLEELDGVVVALAALLRLKKEHLPWVVLPGETAPLQGRLALLVRSGDSETLAFCKDLALPRKSIFC